MYSSAKLLIIWIFFIIIENDLFGLNPLQYLERYSALEKNIDLNPTEKLNRPQYPSR